MSLHIGNTPSFKGVVKVKLVFLDRTQTSSETVVDSAARQLKAILIKKDDDSLIIAALKRFSGLIKETMTIEEFGKIKKEIVEKYGCLREHESLFAKLRAFLKLNKKFKTAKDFEKTREKIVKNYKDMQIRVKIKDQLRENYNSFDRDYKIPEIAPSDDGRYIFGKVRTGTQGSEVYLVSGGDAAAVAKSGKNIGGKEALAKKDYRKTGLVQPAKDNYFSIKDEMAAKYSRDPQKPGIYLYMFTDKKGCERLVGARMENVSNHVNASNPLTRTVVFNPQYVTPKPQTAVAPASNATQIAKTAQATQKSSIIKPEIPSKTESLAPTAPSSTSASSIKDTKPVQMEGLADGIPCEDKGKNPILEELSTKKWDLSLLKPNKKNHKKIKDAPGQTFFNF